MKLNKKLFLTVIAFTIFSIPCCYGGELSNAAKLEYNKGIESVNANQYPQAIECFRRATDINPNYIDAYYNLGTLLEFLNNDEGALAAFKQIILRQPDDYEAVYKAAEISSRLGADDKAKMYLTLIPQDSLIGQKAKQLSDTIDKKLSVPNENIVEPTTAEKNLPKEEPKAQVQNIQMPPQSFSAANPHMDSNGVYSDIASPTGIAVDNSGNLYVAGFSDNTIYKITPDNSKIVHIKDPKIDGPIGIAVDKDGNIYIANYNKNNVLKVEPNGRISEIITEIKQPYCMIVKGNLLFVSSQGSNSVIRFKLYD